MTINKSSSDDFDSTFDEHEEVVSNELKRMEGRYGPVKKPFGSIKLPSFNEIQNDFNDDD